MPNLSIQNINSINSLIKTISTHDKSNSIVKDTKSKQLDTDRSCKSNLSYKTISNTNTKHDTLNLNQENKWDISSAKQPEHNIKHCWDISNNQSFEIGEGCNLSHDGDAISNCGIKSLNQSKSTYNHLLDENNDDAQGKIELENDINAMSVNIDMRNLETIDFNVESQYESKFMYISKLNGTKNQNHSTHATPRMDRN